MSRLLYLGFALPPGVSGLHPQLNPAGHALETQMVEALCAQFEIKSVGLLPFKITSASRRSGSSPGLPHALCLVERPPELFHRRRSSRRLKRAYPSRRRLASPWAENESCRGARALPYLETED